MVCHGNMCMATLHKGEKEAIIIIIIIIIIINLPGNRCKIRL